MSRKAEQPDDWRRYTSDVRPLKRKRRAAGAARTTTHATPVSASRPSPDALPPVSPRPLRDVAAGEAVDLDRRTMDKLTRGRLRPEATLDLHGRTVADAHAAVGTFLARSQARGVRCVLVITGRGKLGEGAIRAELPRWLNAPALRPRVLGFAAAQPRDGGAGAYYVLLRRVR